MPQSNSDDLNRQVVELRALVEALQSLVAQLEEGAGARSEPTASAQPAPQTPAKDETVQASQPHLRKRLRLLLLTLRLVGRL